MSWLDILTGGAAAVAELTPNTWTNRGWREGFGPAPSAAGVHVDHRAAMTCATVNACTAAIAETLASLPGMVYEALPDDNRQRASGGVWEVLHDQPNPEIDSGIFT